MIIISFEDTAFTDCNEVDGGHYLRQSDVEKTIDKLLVKHGLLQTVEDDLESVIDSFLAENEAEPRGQKVDHVLEELLLALFLLLLAARRIFVEKENVSDVVDDVFQTLF